MKKISILKSIILVTLCACAFACNTPGKKAEKEIDKNKISLIEVSITGMSCGGCEQSVQNGVSKLEGIKSVKALSAVGKAFIEYSPALTDTSKIRTAITEAGYTVTHFELMKSEEPAK